MRTPLVRFDCKHVAVVFRDRLFEDPHSMVKALQMAAWAAWEGRPPQHLTTSACWLRKRSEWCRLPCAAGCASRLVNFTGNKVCS